MRSLQVTETWNVMTSSLTWPGPETRKLEGLTIITGLPNCFSCAGCSWAGRDTFLISDEEDRLQVETSGPHVCSFSGGFSAWWWLNSIVSVTLTAITQSVVGCFSVWQSNRYTMTNPYLGSFPKLLCGYISPLPSSWNKKMFCHKVERDEVIPRCNHSFGKICAAHLVHENRPQSCISQSVLERKIYQINTFVLWPHGILNYLSAKQQWLIKNNQGTWAAKTLLMCPIVFTVFILLRREVVILAVIQKMKRSKQHLHVWES